MIARSPLPLAAALCVVTATSLAAASAPPPMPSEEHVLASGLHVVLAPDPTLDDVSVIVRYDVGSSDDPPGKEGLAHLVEHLMFGGSRHVPRGEFWRRMEEAGGGNVNGKTTADNTQYIETVPPEQLPLVFWLESDRMGFVADSIDQAALDRERALVADEIRGRAVDAMLGSLSNVANGEIFPAWHPYRRDLTTDTLGNIQLADVRAFLRTWYTPRNATLVLAGRFQVAPTLALAETYFGDLPAPLPPVRPALPAWQVHDARVEMAAGLNQETVAFLWRAPPLGDRDDLALDLAAAILTDPQGRLQRELVARRLAASVSSRESSLRRASTFVVSATVAQGASPEAVVQAIDSVVSRLASDLTAEECARTRKEWVDTDLLRLETSLGRASRLANLPGRLLDASDHQSIQLADVQRAVRATLVPENRAIVVVHSDRRAPPRGVVVKRTVRAP